MTHKARIALLKSLGWHQPKDPPIQHRICGEVCWWITGNIAGVEYDAWIGETTGMVYLQISPGIDFAFDAFVSVVSNGWPEKKSAPKSRGFDFGDDD
jgi:hypothetical protein